jgi:HK97 family phage major capsid protein
MDLQSLVEKRNKLLVDMQALALAGFTVESRTSFDKMNADVAAFEADIERVKSLNETEASIRHFVPSPRPGMRSMLSDPADDQRSGEKRALLEYMRYGQVSAENRRFLKTETRDLGTVTAGAITGGSQLIPQGMLGVLLESRKAWGALTTVVNTYETDAGNPIKVALTDDSSNMFNTVATEITPASELDPSLSQIISNVDEGDTGLIKISFSQLEDSAFDIDAFVRDNFGKRFWRGITKLITLGNGSNVQSIVSTATLGGTSASPTAVSYADLLTVYAALDPAYIDTANWVMNSTTRASLLGVVDTTGRPLFQPALSSPNGALDMLLGRPVVLNQFQANITAGLRGILFGDMKAGYTLRLVKDGLSILRLSERFADTREIGYFGYGRVGGFATDAGTHPIVALQQHA